jgi:hypothetical protein
MILVATHVPETAMHALPTWQALTNVLGAAILDLNGES